jgi:hypothetical protein
MKEKRTLDGVTYEWDTEDLTRLKRTEKGETTFWKEGIGQVTENDE